MMQSSVKSLCPACFRETPDGFVQHLAEGQSLTHQLAVGGGAGLILRLQRVHAGRRVGVLRLQVRQHLLKLFQPVHRGRPPSLQCAGR